MIGEDVLAETRAFNAQLEDLLRPQPAVHELPPQVTRQARRDGRGVFPALAFDDAASWDEANGVRVRVLEARDAQGAYLHLHGGGWTLGAADQQDALLALIAAEARLTCVSVEYRLAPEHPFPAANDDCETAALWFLDSYAGRLAIGGESAGAHLAVSTLLRLREHGARRFDAANLVFGPYDLTGTPSRVLWGDRDLILSSPVMDWFADLYLPGVPFAERRVPSVSPLFAQLHDLPPALFTCGSADPLLDDSLFMHARWLQAGNASTLSVYAEGIHGFTAFPIEIARRSLAEQVAFLRG